LGVTDPTFGSVWPMDDALLRWVVRETAPGAEVVEVRGLRDGGSPWLVTFGSGRSVVVRTGGADHRAMFATEAAALDVTARHDAVPTPRLLAVSDRPAMLIEHLPGKSRIPDAAPVARLRALGAVVVALQTIVVDGTVPALPRRTRPIPGVDFAALRREQPTRPLLAEAEERVAALPTPGPSTGLVHGDLWQGNALWDGSTLTGLVDWDCAGVGPPGVDLGSLRCDAALCYGPEAADHVLDGYRDAAGRPAEDVAYWDVVAALSTPPDLDWFVGALHGQGRTDLTRSLLVERRDAFLEAALAAL
jgi:aminoglycoside phosphotransferase (APT) family kinase protein